MKILFNTDHNITGKESLTAPFIELIADELRRFSEHITRIEAHLTIEDGHKNGGNDKRCVLEARIEGRQPIAVTSHADTYQQAVDGAIDKLKASLDTIFGRLTNHH
jgi:ribosome-associated translation inhibitor RaiA